MLVAVRILVLLALIVTVRGGFYYQGPKGGVYGPFSKEQLQAWLAQGYFPANLPVSTSPSGRFVPLTQVLGFSATPGWSDSRPPFYGLAGAPGNARPAGAKATEGSSTDYMKRGLDKLTEARSKMSAAQEKARTALKDRAASVGLDSFKDRVGALRRRASHGLGGLPSLPKISLPKVSLPSLVGNSRGDSDAILENGHGGVHDGDFNGSSSDSGALMSSTSGTRDGDGWGDFDDSLIGGEEWMNSSVNESAIEAFASRTGSDPDDFPMHVDSDWAQMVFGNASKSMRATGGNRTFGVNGSTSKPYERLEGTGIRQHEHGPDGLTDDEREFLSLQDNNGMSNERDEHEHDGLVRCSSSLTSPWGGEVYGDREGQHRQSVKDKYRKSALLSLLPSRSPLSSRLPSLRLSGRMSVSSLGDNSAMLWREHSDGGGKGRKFSSCLHDEDGHGEWHWQTGEGKGKGVAATVTQKGRSLVRRISHTPLRIATSMVSTTGFVVTAPARAMMAIGAIACPNPARVALKGLLPCILGAPVSFSLSLVLSLAEIITALGFVWALFVLGVVPNPAADSARADLRHAASTMTRRMAALQHEGGGTEGIPSLPTALMALTHALRDALVQAVKERASAGGPSLSILQPQLQMCSAALKAGTNKLFRHVAFIHDGAHIVAEAAFVAVNARIAVTLGLGLLYILSNAVLRPSVLNAVVTGAEKWMVRRFSLTEHQPARPRVVHMVHATYEALSMGAILVVTAAASVWVTSSSGLGLLIALPLFVVLVASMYELYVGGGKAGLEPRTPPPDQDGLASLPLKHDSSGTPTTEKHSAGYLTYLQHLEWVSRAAESPSSSKLSGVDRQLLWALDRWRLHDALGDWISHCRSGAGATSSHLGPSSASVSGVLFSLMGLFGARGRILSTFVWTACVTGTAALAAAVLRLAAVQDDVAVLRGAEWFVNPQRWMSVMVGVEPSTGSGLDARLTQALSQLKRIMVHVLKTQPLTFDSDVVRRAQLLNWCVCVIAPMVLWASFVAAESRFARAILLSAHSSAVPVLPDIRAQAPNRDPTGYIYTATGWTSIPEGPAPGVEMLGASSAGLGEVSAFFPAGTVTAVVGGTQTHRTALVEMVYNELQAMYVNALKGGGCVSIGAGVAEKQLTRGCISLCGRDLGEWDAKTALAHIVLCRAAHDAAREPRPALPPELLAGLVGTGAHPRTATVATRQEQERILEATGASACLARAAGTPFASSDSSDWIALALNRALTAVTPQTMAVFLDEPTATLTEIQEADFLEFLRRHICMGPGATTGPAVVLSFAKVCAARHADRVLMLGDDGQVLAHGDVVTLMQNENSPLSEALRAALRNHQDPGE